MVAAQLTAGVNSPAVCAIQIVPLDEGMELYPRTMVHLFFLDAKADPKPAGTKLGASSSIDPTIYSLAVDYKLFFAGEIVGFSTVQSPGNRALVLQCMDFSSYWDAAHATAIEYGPGGNALTQKSALYGGDPGLFDDIANHMQERLMGWLSKKPDTPGLQNVGGLAGGIISILEAMGGVPGHYKGINDFFTAAELRCRILNQIAAEQNDHTARNLLNLEVMDEWVRNGLQNIGIQVTFRDILNLLFQYIFYEFVPNPMAMWVPAIPNGATKTVPGTTASIGSAPAVEGAVKLLQSAQNRLQKAIEDGSYSQDAIVTTASVALQEVTLAAADLKNLSSSDPQFASAIAKVNSGITKATIALQPYSSSSAVFTLSGFTNASAAIQGTLSDISSLGNIKVTSKSSVISLATSQRLRSHVIKPDCWFVPPPKCNVIFPEMYTSFNYDRNYLEETTRALMQFYNTLIGPDALLSEYILIPNVGVSTKGLTKFKPGQDYRTLMDHEIHTGIIPKWEKVSNLMAVGQKTNPDARKKVKQAKLSWGSKAGLFHFFKYRFGPRHMTISMRFSPFMVTGFPAVLIRKPYIIPGTSFASSATDKDVIDYVTQNANKLGAPTQFVGMVGSLVHNVDQSGGTTSVSMHHVRLHTGTDDEFLVQYSKDPTIKKKVVKTVVQYAKVQTNPTLLKLLVGCTPQVQPPSTGKTTTKSVSTTQAMASQQVVDQTSGTVSSQPTTFSMKTVSETPTTSPNLDAPLTRSGGTILGANLNRDVVVPNPAGVIKPQSKNGIFAAQGGTVLGVEVLDPQLVQVPGYGQAFGAVAIYEQVSVEFDTLPPFEDLVRPPWFSTNYANVNIGKNIYEPFFGCGSIVDDLIVSGLNQESPAILTDSDAQNFTALETPTQIIQKLQSAGNSNYALSTKTAVDFIGYIYGQIKVKALDVDQFIRSYTERPIASKVNILGSDDLVMAYDKASGHTTVTQGESGFFSASVYPEFAKAGNFAGLLYNPDFAMRRVGGTGAKSALSGRLDIRNANLQKVLAYLDALESHAFIG